MISSAGEHHESQSPSPDIGSRKKVQVDATFHNSEVSRSDQQEEESLLSSGERSILGSREYESQPKSNADPVLANGPRWQPLHTRFLVLAAFCIWFTVLIVALTVLNTVSQRNQGLFQSTNELQYIWRYTPIAVLTLTTSLWGLVDYDARVTAPWSDLGTSYSHQPLHKRSRPLLTDYIDMISINVPFYAARNRHFAVFGSSIILILLQCQTTISAGLLSVSRVELENQEIPVILTSEFTNSQSKNLQDTNSLARSNMETSVAGQSIFPDGCTDRWAHQTFSTVSPRIITSEVVVDALTYGLNCQTVNITVTQLDSSFIAEHGVGILDFRGVFQFGDCEHASHGFVLSKTQNDTNTAHWWSVALVEGFVPGHCNSSALDHNRLLVSFSNIEYMVSRTPDHSEIMSDPGPGSRVNYTYQTTQIRSSALVCAGTYNLTTVTVRTRNKTRELIPVDDQEPRRTLPNFHPWTVIKAADNATLFSAGVDPSPQGPLPSQLQSCGGNCSAISNWDESNLHNAWNEYFQRYAVFYWHEAIRSPANIATLGTATITGDRLLVHVLACQMLIGSLALCVFFTVGLGFVALNCYKFPFQIGNMWSIGAFAGKIGLSAFPRELGGTDLEQLKMAIGHPQHQIPNFDQAKPPKLISAGALRSISRMSILIFIVFLVAALEITLARSSRMTGLGDISENAYLHYAWTTGPAFISTLLSMAISSVDFQTRMLEPFVFLHRAAALEILTLDLLRPFLPSILKVEWRLKSFGALATSVATLVAAWITIASASLFHETAVPATSELQVQSNSHFISSARWYYGYASGLEAQILLGNLSYPATTFENLVFPEFFLDAATLDSTYSDLNATNIRIATTVQALRPGLSACHLYSDTEIETTRIQKANVTVSLPYSPYSTKDIMDVITVTVQGQSLHDCPWREASWDLNVEGNFTATFPVPISIEGQFGAAHRRCSSYLFIWGRHSLDDPASSSTSVLSCNQTIGDVVSVAMNFVGSNLMLDLTRPPQQLNATSIWNSPPRLSVEELGLTGNALGGSSNYGEGVESSVFDMPLDELYTGLMMPSMPKSSSFDGFFGQLVTSRYAVPLKHIGDILQERTVKDAILFQHGIIAAQALNGVARYMDWSVFNVTDMQIGYKPLTLLSTSIFEPNVFNATVTYDNGRLRLIQDEKATRTLQALLALTMVLFLLGWGLGYRKPVLPRVPTSVASVLAFLAGGDLLKVMYKGKDDQEARTIHDLKLMLGNECRVWIGMGPPRELALNVAGDQRFGVWITTVSSHNYRDAELQGHGEGENSV